MAELALCAIMVLEIILNEFAHRLRGFVRGVEPVAPMEFLAVVRRGQHVAMEFLTLEQAVLDQRRERRHEQAGVARALHDQQDDLAFSHGPPPSRRH